VDVLEDEDQRSPARQGPEQPGGRREHLGEVLGVGLGVVPLDGGAQRVGLVGAGPLRVEPGEEVAEGGERDAVVEVVGPTDDDRVTELAGLDRQLGDQARLPHAGLAADQQRGGGPACAARQLLSGDRQVEVAPDQRRRAHRRHCPPFAGSVGRGRAASACRHRGPGAVASVEAAAGIRESPSEDTERSGVPQPALAGPLVTLTVTQGSVSASQLRSLARLPRRFPVCTGPGDHPLEADV
jgi:hypothetical protein